MELFLPSSTSSFSPVLALLLCAAAAAPPPPTVRQYFIAAVEIGWDYVHLQDAAAGPSYQRRSKEVPQKYIKAVYREYTDQTYSVPRQRAAWTGIQGPVIVANAGDRVLVHFKNLASRPFSISPVGISYSKQSEGAGYDDSTAGQEKEDDAVPPGGYYLYVWDISAKDGPTIRDPDCLTYTYSSQVDTVRDLNSGLIGALLICKTIAFTDGGQRKYPAFVLLFTVFDETKSWYGEVGERMSREKFRKSTGRKEYHTINGYVNSTLPGLLMCQSRNPVFWHLVGVGTAPEIHSIRFQDHSLQVLKHRKVTLELTPMTFITAEMKPTATGQFLITCQIHAHRNDGMDALFRVAKCPDPVAPPLPDRRNVKHTDENEDFYSDEDFEDLFHTISFQPNKPLVNARASTGHRPGTWEHYIAAEEVTWHYAPHLRPTDRELQSRFLPTAPHHLSYTYKKVVYVEYTDGSFTQRINPDITLPGPLLKGKVNDKIHITFKNMASRPFNIFPNGLSNITSLHKSINGKSLRSMEVAPNSTFGYVWLLTTGDGPLKGDPTCLTQLYQSTVSADRDLASGLVGTLLICKSDAFDARGRLLGPDKKLSLMFAVFDENKSWYFSENMQQSTLNSSSDFDVDFYDSNVIYSVNGIMFSKRQFVMCQSDVPFWHVAHVSTQSDFLSVYFTGNLFEHDNHYQSVITLFPMTAVTFPMETEVIGEWEISAFDSSLRNRGMSIRYTVRPCNSGDLPLVDHDDNEDITDYLDEMGFHPRGFSPQNVELFETGVGKNDSRSINSSRVNATDGQHAEVTCQQKEPVTSVEGGEPLSEDGIPQDILEEMQRNEEPRRNNQSQPGEQRSSRRRREADGNWKEGDAFESFKDEDARVELVEQSTEHTNLEVEEETEELRDNTNLEVEEETEELRDNTNLEVEEETEELRDNLNQTIIVEENKVNNEILITNKSLLTKTVSSIEMTISKDWYQSSLTENHIMSELSQLYDESEDLDNKTWANDSSATDTSIEYDNYSEEVNSTADTFGSDYFNMRSGEIRPRLYYIAAEEISWDYGIRTPHQLIKPKEMRRGMRKFLTEYKKVVFRAYRDKDFLNPVGRGELQEHLGIMGPVIRTEINDLLTVIFKNNAFRPYSFHLQGVYDRSQGAGYAQTSSSSAPPGVPGEPVPPGEARTYNWRVTMKQGPTENEFDCKTGAYYSTVDKERDLHSGLIGPLVICKSGTLHSVSNTQQGMQDFALLFHTFDETKSWYMEENLQHHCAPPCRANTEDPWYHTSNTFSAINGYVAETLPGLLVAQYKPIRWHLLNVGGDKEYHAVHFHGLPFTVHTKGEHRLGVFNLFPGVFGTVEMQPPTVGTWLVECTIADYQLAGMRAKLLVYNPECALPLGMKSGRIEDSHITASDYIDNWEPRLARLDQSGYINAWMGNNKRSWLQVDLQRPTLLHGVLTQGVRAKLRDRYITFFTVSYSLNKETWTTYRGNNSKQYDMIFHGNLDSSKVKDNRFSQPFMARYVRIQPFRYVQRPALRLELLGCDLNSCSLPLGLQERKIPDSNFSASSYYSSLLRTWSPHLARLHQEGGANAWRPKNNNPHEWLQVDLGTVRRITGVVTQGAQSLLTKMMVTEFSVTVSYDGHVWSSVLETSSHREKIFMGNTNPDEADEEAHTMFDPPLFGRFLRFHPRGWINDIALRLELLGCDTQQRP